MIASAEKATDPLDGITWPVGTARLHLRRAQRPDAEATWAFRRSPEFTQWMTREPVRLEEHTTQFADEGSLARTLVIELDGIVIADLWVSVQDARSQAEVVEHARGVQADLGCGLHPAQNAHGYATEAMREVQRLCCEELMLRRLTADCFADNTAAWRLMERVRMRREANTVRDCLHSYALLAEEWKDRPDHFVAVAVLTAPAGGSGLRDGAQAGSTGRDVANVA